MQERSDSTKQNKGEIRIMAIAASMFVLLGWMAWQNIRSFEPFDTTNNSRS